MLQVTEQVIINDKDNQLQQLHNAIAFLENATKNTSVEKEISNRDIDIDIVSVNPKNKVKYDSNVSNEEKVDGFRKQGEYGPKKFIKP